jgi:hypothetical protein
MNKSTSDLDRSHNTDTKTPPSFNLSVEERLRILANLIIDRIIEDQKQGIVRVNQSEQVYAK